MYNWTTAQVKERAKNSFRTFGYWIPFLIMLILSFIPFYSDSSGSFVSLLFSFLQLISAIFGSALYGIFSPEGRSEMAATVGSAMAALSTAAFLSIIAFTVVVTLLVIAFVISPLVVGKNRYFMEHRGSSSDIGRVFWVFGSGKYLNVVKTMLLMYIKIFLWSLLFLIPGIIKRYEYFAIPYILAENPGIDSKRAFELSRQMTMGEKFDIWWLGITFIGWYILCFLTCGVGEYFLNPYIQATNAEVYAVLRERAHENGITDFSELPGFFPAAY